jgi:hypothetical protein
MQQPASLLAQRIKRKDQGLRLGPNDGEEPKIITPTPVPSKEQLSITPPSFEQIAKLTLFCQSDSTVRSVCKDPNFMPGYYSNTNFRFLIDDLVRKYEIALSSQEQNTYNAQRRQAECLLEPTPVDERNLTPQQQKYIRETKCGISTPESELNYKLYQQQQYGDCMMNKIVKNDYSWGYCDYLKPIFY